MDTILKECDVCKARILQIREDGRAYAVDFPEGGQHECFDIPEGAEVIILED